MNIGIKYPDLLEDLELIHCLFCRPNYKKDKSKSRGKSKILKNI